jgi:hypothetical protein
VIGGFRALSNDFKCLDSILEISLEVPRSTKELTTMKQARRFHGVGTFGDKIVIFGGAESLALERSELQPINLQDLLYSLLQQENISLKKEIMFRSNIIIEIPDVCN